VNESSPSAPALLLLLFLLQLPPLRLQPFPFPPASATCPTLRSCACAPPAAVSPRGGRAAAGSRWRPPQKLEALLTRRCGRRTAGTRRGLGRVLRPAHRRRPRGVRPRRRSEFLVRQATNCAADPAAGRPAGRRRPVLRPPAPSPPPWPPRCRRRDPRRRHRPRPAALGPPQLPPGAGTVHEGDLFQALPDTCAAASASWSPTPPYVPTAALAALPPGSRDHEPATALNGGHDGTDLAPPHRRLAATGAPGGTLLDRDQQRQVPLTVQAFPRRRTAAARGRMRGTGGDGRPRHGPGRATEWPSRRVSDRAWRVRVRIRSPARMGPWFRCGPRAGGDGMVSDRPQRPSSRAGHGRGSMGRAAGQTRPSHTEHLVLTASRPPSAGVRGLPHPLCRAVRGAPTACPIHPYP